VEDLAEAIILQSVSQHSARMVSVVVINWNRRQLLRACLESLARQSGVAFEVIVVDNGSTDGSADVARGLGARIVTEPQRGFGAACDAGLRAATAHWRWSSANSARTYGCG
jgi:glycosyltransferase involved in cell wall biosynthesis